MKHIGFEKLRKLNMVIIFALSILVFTVNTWADTFDPSHLGSISMTLHTTVGDVPVPGAEFYIYKAADCHFDGTVLKHTLTTEFAASGIDLSQVDKKETAEAAALYASTSGASHLTVVTDSDGKFVKDSLSVGLYLVVQNNTVSDFSKAAPFFITVGRISGSNVYYDADATPKVDVKGKDIPVIDPPGTRPPNGIPPSVVPPSKVTPAVTPGVTPVVSPSPTDSFGEPAKILAQTGQNRWQIPFLACIGLGLILAGLMLKTGKDEN